MDDGPEPKHGWSCLRGLRVAAARVGVHPHEQRRRQPIEVDVALWLDTAAAARSDSLADTADWVAVAELVHHVVGMRHYNLVETLTEGLAAALLQHFAVARVRVEVRKPESMPQGMAAVRIERWR